MADDLFCKICGKRPKDIDGDLCVPCAEARQANTRRVHVIHDRTREKRIRWLETTNWRAFRNNKLKAICDAAGMESPSE